MKPHDLFMFQASLSGFAVLCLVGALVIDIVRTLARRGEAVEPPIDAPVQMTEEWLRRSTGITDGRYTPAELEGIRRYREGQPLGFSFGVHEDLTYGYGLVHEETGQWEFPVPYDQLAREDREAVREASYDLPGYPRREPVVLH